MKRLTPAQRKRNQRKRLYELGLTLIGVAAAYGLVNGQEAAAWALVLAPLLGLARSKVDA